MISGAVQAAYEVLETGRPISRALAMELARLRGEAVLDLVSLANKVRNRYAPGTYACSILNAKSGRCGENCRFCAQSARHAAAVAVYPLMDVQAMVAAARKAWSEGVRSFGLVTSGRGYDTLTPEFDAVCDAIRAIREALPDLEVCASLGMLGDEPARRLAACGIRHYNINLQTPPARYAELVADTHTAEERVETIRRLRRAGVSVCCGGILGLGETLADRLELAFTIRDLDVAVIPLNVLIPVAGTPVENRATVPAWEVAVTFALFRLIHPARILKFAAGRETVMKDFQALLMLSGANGFITGGYLTTRGRCVAEDLEFAGQLAGFQG
jgi:biotin synthase